MVRIRIHSCDEAEPFARFLPREGVVVAMPRCSDSRHAWHLVRLDRSVRYQALEFSHCLVASRWLDRPINRVQPASVFLLLVPAGQAAVPDGFSRSQYLRVARGAAQMIAGEAGASQERAPAPGVPGPPPG
ncbi:MAG TPA: hypothetical protein VFA86_00020 [Gammaproteobacteria bacterium]|nr:hypothetical protein [Gammaproteobacteria bacterium]